MIIPRSAHPLRGLLHANLVTVAPLRLPIGDRIPQSVTHTPEKAFFKHALTKGLKKHAFWRAAVSALSHKGTGENVKLRTGERDLPTGFAVCVSVLLIKRFLFAILGFDAGTSSGQT